ncbi:ATPase, T2SS/T4P/T4SS family [Aquabacterium sp.]|uniref:ATPase, T2SS/T4P/T4SS family n=1 Tax=Aquabacterium sp. TaxID=1872578 RepID=UPI0019942716|nr:ATPase, T2SS/T4P/T4SS family [Aquabacterium sp.]MBC7699455.1 Flp pilus assembly complex ATPase component TadA [Aquabacterium sp.]
MMNILIDEPDGTVREMQVGDDCVIGKNAKSEIHLSSWRVAKEHARLFRTPSGVLVEDMGAFGGVTVNGERIDIQHGPLKASDVIGVGPYKLRIKGATEGAKPVRPSAQPDTAAQARRHAQTAEILQASHTHARRVQSEIVRTREVEASEVTPAAEGRVSLALVLLPDQDQREMEFEWRKRIHGLLLETMDLRRQDVSRMTDERLRQETESLIRTLLKERDREIPPTIDRQLLCRQVLNEAVGLGPLEELLADDQVTEIMVNRYNEIFVERAGRLQRHPLTFTGDRAVMGVIERIVAPLGRRIDESSPMVDARLKDGSRVNAIIPPLALKGPTLTIRKFSKRKLAASDLVSSGSISPAMAEFLQICVERRKNMVVSGGTGSGKTTLLNILSNFIPAGERVITVEDAAELQLNHEHLISLESRPPNVEGKGGVQIRDLVKNTLRMRPDRIVVGECRGAEALDMLQAMNTGHEGSLTTLHANTPRDGLARLETMVLMAGMELPLVAIREQIASAVDIIVQQTRFSCGTRMVTHIAEITGIESGTIQIQDLFKFVNRGYDPNTGKVRGYFTGCDMAPCFYEDLLASGQALDLSIFKPTGPDTSHHASLRHEMDEDLL